jgi:hypothetical protein
MNSNDSNKFKIGSIIIAKDPSDDLYANDIGIIMNISDYLYTVHWFKYYDFGELKINYIDTLIDDDIDRDYKVLK